MLVGLIIGLLVGLLIGGVAVTKKMIFSSVGALRIDTSDPDDNPYLFLELSTDLNLVLSQEYVVLKVNTSNYISQK